MNTDPTSPGAVSRARVQSEISAEADAMISRSARGVAKDDEKSLGGWLRTLFKVLDPEYATRHMWIKVGAVAVRAVEAIDREGK